MSGLDKVKEELMKVIEKEVQDYTDEVYRSGYEDAKKKFIGKSAKQIQIKYHDDFATALEKMYEYEERQHEEQQEKYDIEEDFDEETRTVRYTFVPKKERQTEKSCENCKYYNGGYATFVCADGCKDKSNWKPQTDEIKVGDEVKVYDDCIGIVTRHAPQARTCYVMYRDGSCGEEELTDCKKTGNHSMSLDKWLEQIRKESHD